MGGDLEHTHLVKGLDYSLLTKVKAELAKQDRDQLDTEKSKVEKTAPQTKFHKVLNKDGRVSEVENPIEFQSHVGRSVYNAIFNRERPPTVDHFLPGRTMFVYDLDPEAHQDLPTTVKRSKDACPDASQFVVAKTHPELLSRITKIMIYYTQVWKFYPFWN